MNACPQLLWLLGWLRPDFKTIADLLGDKRAAFKAVFRTFVLLRRKLDLFQRELLAADGRRRAVKVGERLCA